MPTPRHSSDHTLAPYFCFQKDNRTAHPAMPPANPLRTTYSKLCLLILSFVSSDMAVSCVSACVGGGRCALSIVEAADDDGNAPLCLASSMIMTLSLLCGDRISFSTPPSTFESGTYSHPSGTVDDKLGLSKTTVHGQRRLAVVDREPNAHVRQFRTKYRQSYRRKSWFGYGKLEIFEAQCATCGESSPKPLRERPTEVSKINKL